MAGGGRRPRVEQQAAFRRLVAAARWCQGGAPARLALLWVGRERACGTSAGVVVARGVVVGWIKGRARVCEAGTLCGSMQPCGRKRGAALGLLRSCAAGRLMGARARARAHSAHLSSISCQAFAVPPFPRMRHPAPAHPPTCARPPRPPAPPRPAQVEVSLQPWRAFQPDGVILFSDILTPIAGMNIPFDITAGKGPVIFDPIRTMEVGGRAQYIFSCAGGHAHLCQGACMQVRVAELAMPSLAPAPGMRGWPPQRRNAATPRSALFVFPPRRSKSRA